MSTPPVEGTPLVVYCGPDSDGVVERWEESESERPFDLRGVTPGGDVETVLDGTPFDCVVCHATGEESADLSRVVGLVRQRDRHVPVVVFDGGDAFDVGAAVDIGVTQYFDVSGEFDAVAEMERLGPTVERAQRERRERSMLDSLLWHIPLSVYFKDRTGRHVRVSDALPSLIGPSYLESPDGKRHHAPEDVVGKTDFDLYPDDLAEATAEDDRAVVDSGEAIGERIERSVGTDLDETYVATSKAPWYDEHGDVVGLVGVTRDITDRQKYEKQLERQNERLERFAGVISHDLRNPLEVAFARLEFAQETGESEHFDAAEDALDRMNALIDDVLTLTRQGETVDDPELVALDAAATDAWDVVDTRGATLDAETTGTIQADPGRLQQLFENVFRNALEHGGDTVTVRVGDLPDEPGFFVADDGPGIPGTDRDSVFDSGYSTSDSGTGLGLSIVRTIAEAHGWDVRVTESRFPDPPDPDGADNTGAALRGARFEFTGSISTDD
jgi:two-component system aerobic respiration control sensor histidine kinase ArcB